MPEEGFPGLVGRVVVDRRRQGAGGGPAVSFPPHDRALSLPNGLLAVGGDLELGTLEEAYRNGIFPWFEDSGRIPVCWWSPDPRAVLEPERFHSSRSLARSERRLRPDYRVDGAFGKVLDGCSRRNGSGESGWLGESMRGAYVRLHRAGAAHSFEAWSDGRLAGAVLYVQFGAYFSGETMFSAASDGSKLALREMCRRLAAAEVPLLDCQLMSDHLGTLGAGMMERKRFLAAIRRAQQAEAPDLSEPAPRGHG